MIRAFFAVAACAFLGLLAFTYLGLIHPAADSFAVFRLEIALAAAFFTIWTAWRAWFRWPLTLLCLAIALPLAAPSLFSANAALKGGVTLYQQNLLFSRREDAVWLREIRVQKPDLITLQEVSGRNKALLEALRGDYPSQHYCDFSTVGGTAVLSRWSVLDGTAFCAGRSGMSGMQVMTGQGPLWLISVHLHWPWPYGQAEQVEKLLPVLEGLDGPVLIGGDFNAVAWSTSVKRMARAIGGTRVPHAGRSFTLPLFAKPVTIDHVLSNTGGAQEAVSLPRLGSDHNGVLARMTR